MSQNLLLISFAMGKDGRGFGASIPLAFMISVAVSLFESFFFKSVLIPMAEKCDTVFQVDVSINPLNGFRDQLMMFIHMKQLKR